MRSLSSTLTAAQKAPMKPLCKLVLTKTGLPTITYTTSRIIDLLKIEEQHSARAQVLLDNSDKVLTDLDVRGYTGTISHGFTTASGDEYSAIQPMKVIAQQDYSAPGLLTCYLALCGYFNLMREDKANDHYIADPISTDTVKTIFSAVAGATLSVFDHCIAYTVAYDSEDSLIDTFQPKESFAISRNESRFNVLKKVLSWTECVMRMEDDGKIHVLVPTIS